MTGGVHDPWPDVRHYPVGSNKPSPGPHRGYGVIWPTEERVRMVELPASERGDENSPHLARRFRTDGEEPQRILRPHPEAAGYMQVVV